MMLAATWSFTSVGAEPAVTGQARAVQAMTLLSTTVLADTGTLGGASDARDATLDSGYVPSMVSGETMRAVTVGWPDQVVSEASVADLNVAIGGTGISADFIMASARSALDGGSAASAEIGNLTVNGVPVMVTGAPNQLIPILGGRLVLNEQRTSAAGITVNAIHATVAGMADVVIASATAGIQ